MPKQRTRNAKEVVTECMFEKQNVLKVDVPVIKEFRENRRAIVCLLCSNYSLQISRQMKLPIVQMNRDVMRCYPRRQLFYGGSWPAQQIHKLLRIHKECCRQHFDKDKDWLTGTIVTLRIDSIFAPAKRAAPNTSLQNRK